MTSANPPEPSMDEILASIRRIISEDVATVEPVPSEPDASAGDDDDVLILRERAPPASNAAAPPEASDRAKPRQDVRVVPLADQPLVSPEVARAAAESFERLHFVVDNPPPSSPLAVAATGATLEDLTRELLRPVVKAWLDENLEAIVRARVDEEVARIARGRVR
jgi:cell pole-organizing protein PopZ